MLKKVVLISLFFFLTFFTDQLIKFWITNYFNNQVRFGYFFDLVLIKNASISFGLFGSSLFVLILIILGIIFLCFLTIFYLDSEIGFIGAGLILGGGVSNFVDRFIHGAVIDYINFLHYPAFNLADIGIFCGTLLIIYTLLKK